MMEVLLLLPCVSHFTFSNRFWFLQFVPSFWLVELPCSWQSIFGGHGVDDNGDHTVESVPPNGKCKGNGICISGVVDTLQ